MNYSLLMAAGKVLRLSVLLLVLFHRTWNEYHERPAYFRDALTPTDSNHYRFGKRADSVMSNYCGKWPPNLNKELLISVSQIHPSLPFLPLPYLSLLETTMGCSGGFVSSRRCRKAVEKDTSAAFRVAKERAKVEELLRHVSWSKVANYNWLVVSNILHFQPYLGMIIQLTIFGMDLNHQPVNTSVLTDDHVW